MCLFLNSRWFVLLAVVQVVFMHSYRIFSLHFSFGDISCRFSLNQSHCVSFSLWIRIRDSSAPISWGRLRWILRSLFWDTPWSRSGVLQKPIAATLAPLTHSLVSIFPNFSWLFESLTCLLSTVLSCTRCPRPRHCFRC